MRSILQVFQASFAILALVFSSYVTWWNSQDKELLSTHAAWPQVSYLLFTSSFGITSVMYIHFIARQATPSNRKSLQIPVFLLLGLNTFFQMSGFIALSVFLAKMTHCTGAVCWAARMDAFFVALGYAVWAAAAVIAGIEISNGLKQDREALKAVNEVKAGAKGLENA